MKVLIFLNITILRGGIIVHQEGLLLAGYRPMFNPAYKYIRSPKPHKSDS